MLPVETLTFSKEQCTLPCKIVRMQLDDLDIILDYQQKLCDTLQDADIFVPLSRQEWQYLLDHGFALAVLPENPPAYTDSIAYLIGCLYPADAENLGPDAGLSGEQLLHTANLEIAMASPDWRGWHMHSRMCQRCVRLLSQDGRTHYVLATASPRNLPSVRALESAGLQTVVIKEKYGGKLRCIMLKCL